jgi:hypothetical protein
VPPTVTELCAETPAQIPANKVATIAFFMRIPRGHAARQRLGYEMNEFQRRRQLTLLSSEID